MARHRSSKVYSSRARRFAIADGGQPAISRHKRFGKQWCGRRDSNPHELLAQRIFVPSTAFAALTQNVILAPGLGSGLSLHPPPKDAGLRCCPSSLYTFPDCSMSSRLGSGLPFQVSPNLGSSASPVSQASTQSSSSPLRLPVPPRPHGFLFKSTYHKGRPNVTSVWA